MIASVNPEDGTTSIKKYARLVTIYMTHPHVWLSGFVKDQPSTGWGLKPSTEKSGKKRWRTDSDNGHFGSLEVCLDNLPIHAHI